MLNALPMIFFLFTLFNVSTCAQCIEDWEVVRRTYRGRTSESSPFLTEHAVIT